MVSADVHDVEGGDSSIDITRLERESERLREVFHNAKPWPHLVIDDILRQDIAIRAAANFPKLGKVRSRLAWLLQARSFERRVERHDPAIVKLFEELHGRRFTSWLERLTGIDHLDPDMDMIGAGIHQGGNGSFLRVHADHNTHPHDTKRFRRVNVLLYLNETWKQEWNGDLELWDRHAIGCEKRVEPIINRCIVMAVDDTSYHGYGPLRLPNGLTRNALAAYYYSDVAAEGQTHDPHPTTLPRLKNQSAISIFSQRVRRALLKRVEKALEFMRSQNRQH